MANRKSTTPNVKANTSHKRQLSSSNDPSVVGTSASRSSKRIRESIGNNSVIGSKSTPTKSKYFEAESDEDEEEEEEEEKEESGYEDEDVSVTELSSPSEEEEEEEVESEEYDSDEEDTKAKQRRRKQQQQLKQKSKTKLSNSNESNVLSSTTEQQKDLWRQGVKTGLGPGKQVYIEKPKPRSDGGVKYVADRIHPNTFLFLSDLKRNNDREWLKMHDPDYRQSWKDWESFVESLTEKISEFDETIPELPPKDLVFRIYRDVRFSPDPTPYKPFFSAAWSRTGRKGPYACYYVQIQPGASFIGGGLWMPEAQPLSLVRTDIDRRPRRIKQILTDAGIRKYFLGAIPSDEKKAIKAFANQNSENALKTKPKGYEADNANIELLRLRNYTMGRKLKDDEVLGPQGLHRITSLLAAMTPFVTYLNSVVMPDDDDEEEDDADTDNDASNSVESEHGSVDASA